MKLAIASGKGGTGKTTVSTNLSYLLSTIYKDVCLVDCDVEEPNCHIFMKPDFTYTEKVLVPVPKIDDSKCIACAKCAEVCEYNALAFVKNKVIVFEELCHGCGNCKLICPSKAISEGGREVGTIEAGYAQGFNFVHGKSRIGEAMSPPLIKAVKKYTDKLNPTIQVLDCPPGTSCPVINTLNGADFVFMVTEPTPFGLYDLKLAVEVIRKMKLQFAVIINRSGENDILIKDYAKAEKIEIIAKIPDSREIAECYSKGELIVKSLPKFKDSFNPLIAKIREVK